MKIYLVFYSSKNKSGLTYPVCIAIYTCPAISVGNWLKASWCSMRLLISNYIMPFLFVPAFLMKGSAHEIVFIFIGAVLLMFAIEAGLMGFFTKLSTHMEWILYLGGLLMIAPGYYTFIGMGLFVLGYLCERLNPTIQILSRKPALSTIRQTM